MLLRSNEGAEVKVVAPIYDKTPHAVIYYEDLGITTPKDLEGKRWRMRRARRRARSSRPSRPLPVSISLASTSGASMPRSATPSLRPASWS
jgi:hypothetical protein